MRRSSYAVGTAAVLVALVAPTVDVLSVRPLAVATAQVADVPGVVTTTVPGRPAPGGTYPVVPLPSPCQRLAARHVATTAALAVASGPSALRDVDDLALLAAALHDVCGWPSNLIISNGALR